MHIIDTLQQCPPDAQHAVIALGNFDGMHKGHQAVITRATTIAASLNALLAVLTFEPHPLSVFHPQGTHFRLTTLAQKVKILEALGVNIIFALPFTLDFAKLSPQDFISDILVSQLKVRHIVTGEDFIFGHQRTGNTKLLQELAPLYQFGYSAIMPVTLAPENIVYSSTQTRHFITDGEVDKARLILGRNFSIAGNVIHGKQHGRQLGFPTANVALNDYIRPMFGVYASIIHIDNARYLGVSNIGYKPTLGNHEPLLEVHIFDFDQEIYGRYIEVELVQFLRREQKFNSLTELSAQIEADCKHAKTYLGAL